MADEPETTEAPEAEAPAEGGDKPTLAEVDQRQDRLESKLDQVIDFLKGGAAPAAKAEPETPDIKAEAREAVREVQAADRKREQRATVETEMRERLAHLEKLAEVKPVEYNPHTRWWWQPEGS